MQFYAKCNMKDLIKNENIWTDVELNLKAFMCLSRVWLHSRDKTAFSVHALGFN